LTPSLEGPFYPDISTIQFHSDDIAHLLQEQNPYKASGPIGISARFLKEASINTYSTSCNSMFLLLRVREIGKMLLVLQFLRRQILPTIVSYH